MLPNFIPIEMAGMSVITAICIFFIMAGAVIVYKMIMKKFEIHDLIINRIETDLNTMKVDVAETKVVVQGIKESLSSIAETNMEVMKILAKK